MYSIARTADDSGDFSFSEKIYKYSNVNLEEWILIKKESIRQDLQD
jgi:hypothetical protein